MPWQLVLSPNAYAAWFHALNPVTRNGRTELWHTRLGVRLSPLTIASANTPADSMGLYEGSYQYAPLDTPDGRHYVVSSVVREGDSQVGIAAPLRTVRAIWSPDYPPEIRLRGDNSPFRMSLTGGDRAAIVRISADFSNLPPNKRSRPTLVHTVPPSRTYRPLPSEVNRLMLSTLGAWIDVQGAWDTNPFGVPLEEWRHRATMGHDH